MLRGLVLDNGRTWGEAALPFQLGDARAVLDSAGPSMAFLTRARGASKTVDLAGMLVAVLLEQAPTGSRSYAIAADEDQAGLLVDAIRGFVARTAGLPQLLRVEAKRVTVLGSGATLEALAADGPSTYGLRPYFVVVDELAQWRSTREARAVWTAIISAMAKDQAARLVLLTTAGDPSHWSYRILQHARTSARWHVREVPGPSPWATAEALEELADGSLDLTALVSLARRELREVLEPAELLVFLATVAADLVRTVAEIRDVPFDACLESLQTHLLTANREV